MTIYTLTIYIQDIHMFFIFYIIFVLSYHWFIPRFIAIIFIDRYSYYYQLSLSLQLSLLSLYHKRSTLTLVHTKLNDAMQAKFRDVKIARHMIMFFLLCDARLIVYSMYFVRLHLNFFPPIIISIAFFTQYGRKHAIF